MSHRFRLATDADLHACAALLREEGCFAGEEQLWGRLPGLWRSLLDSPAAQFVVYEDLAAPAAERLQGFTLSAIVQAEFAQELRARRRPWSASLFWGRLGTRASPLSGERELARANSGDGVTIVMLHSPVRYRSLRDPRLEALLPLVIDAFRFCHAGHFARAVLWEVYGAEHAQILADGGYRLLDNYESDPAACRVPAERRPLLMGLLREDAALGAYHPNALWLFQRQRPQLRLTPAQRRLLRRALLGESDRAVAAALGVSEHTVRQGWREIHERARSALPGIFPVRRHEAGESHGAVERGPSLRSALLDYLRQHLHELRPFDDDAAPPHHQ